MGQDQDSGNDMMEHEGLPFSSVASSAEDSGCFAAEGSDEEESEAEEGSEGSSDLALETELRPLGLGGAGFPCRPSVLTRVR